MPASVANRRKLWRECLRTRRIHGWPLWSARHCKAKRRPIVAIGVGETEDVSDLDERQVGQLGQPADFVCLLTRTRVIGKTLRTARSRPTDPACYHRGMLSLLRDLVAHKGHANRTMLAAIEQHADAAADHDIVELLHHILVANRFWYLLWVGEWFDTEREFQRSASLSDLQQRYEALQSLEASWLDGLSETHLERMLETPHIPGGRCTVAEGLMQVCMHSQGHRSQLAKMLRAHGATPPMTDFILWVAQRPPR